MPRGALIGRIFGTDIFATGSFLLLMVFLLVVYHESAAFVAISEIALIVSVLVHEFGHVFAVRWLLGSSSIVVLWGLGGLCIHEPTRVIRKRIGISLMGPAFGLVLGVACLLVFRYLLPEGLNKLVLAFFEAMVYINIVYTGLNLLPILPLDGGQATLAALEWKLGPGRAMLVARRISIALSVAALPAAFRWGGPIMAAIVLMLLLQNLLGARERL